MVKPSEGASHAPPAAAPSSHVRRTQSLDAAILGTRAGRGHAGRGLAEPTEDVRANRSGRLLGARKPSELAFPQPSFSSQRLSLPDHGEQISSFPAIDKGGDGDVRSNAHGGVDTDANGGNEFIIDRMLAKVPQSVWQPNAVVPRHRRKANLYWLLLLFGYIVYIGLAIRDAFRRRRNPPVQLTRVEEPFQLPDVGFCFEGDTYGSRFGCYDGDADGKECAASYIADVFVYGYNHTGYTTPEGYEPSSDYIVLLPDNLSDTCRRFRLSELTAVEDAEAWRFHMLMFWNSSYDPSLNPGAFESIKMYLYEGDLTANEVLETPITMYAPISFDAAEVPFVRGFLEYEQQVDLENHVEHTFTVVDTTSSRWHNAEDAVDLAAGYGTDSLASIQLDIRTQSYFQYKEVDPLDIVGTLGEITGFWLVVPLLFGVLFYRPEVAGEDAEMRKFKLCRRRKSPPLSGARTGFSLDSIPDPSP